MIQFISFSSSMENSRTGIYHIGIQGNTNTNFNIKINEQNNEIKLGPAGQWEIYSEDLKNMYIQIILNDSSQLGYIEYKDGGED